MLPFCVKWITCAIILLVGCVTLTKATCSMYGHCNANEKGYQNCNTTGSQPQQLDDETALSLLKEKCPFLVTDDDPNPLLCCDAAQATEMSSQVEMLSVFSRCPTCSRNMATNICMFSCSADQGEFVNVRTVEEDGNYGNGAYITEVEVIITESFMDTTYESCKQVSLPSTGGLIMDTLACIEYGSAYCTPQRFFDYIGLTNPYLPFSMYYIPEGSEELWTYKAMNCNETFEGEAYACSCIDCELSCSLELFPELDSGFLIANLNGYTFIIAIVLFALSLASPIIIYLTNCRKPKETHRDQVHTYEESTNTFDSVLQNIFRKIGVSKYMQKLE